MLTATASERAIDRLAEATTADDPSLPVARALFAGLGSAGSIERYGHDLAALGRWAIARERRLLELERADLLDYLALLRDAERAPDTVRRIQSVIRRFYGEAMRAGLVRPPGPADALPRVRGESQVPAEAALTAAEISALFGVIEAGLAARDPRRCLRAERDRVIVACLIWLGLRAAELCSLRVSDRRSLRGYRILSFRGKGRYAATAKLTPELDGLIDGWLTASARAGLVLRPLDPLFPPLGRAWPPRAGGQAGPRHLSPHTLYDLVSGYLDAIGRSGHRSSPHQLRKTSVTAVWEASGGNLVLAQRHARHRQPNTTVRHYIDPADDLAQTGVDTLELPLPGATSQAATSSIERRPRVEK